MNLPGMGLPVQERVIQSNILISIIKIRKSDLNTNHSYVIYSCSNLIA